MAESLNKQIVSRTKKSRRGSVYFADSFKTVTSAKTANKSLERLAKSGELQRIATGIYVRPIQDKVIGTVLPGIEEIANAIAKRDKAHIVPTGSYALYKLGLTTQVPMNAVYHTDASARKVRIGKQTITFKKVSAKHVAAIGSISKLVIQALRTLGKDNVTDEQLQKIREVLKKEKPYHLEHDLRLAPEWIRKLLTTPKSNASSE